MKSRLLPGLCALLLLLSACSPQEGAASPAPEGATPTLPPVTGSPTAGPEETLTPIAPEVTPAFDAVPTPVTEEAIRSFYAQDGYEVRKLISYEGDFLVEYGRSNIPHYSLLGWVFGETGREVQLTAMTEFASYEVTGPGEVTYTTTGQDTTVPYTGLPETVTLRVLGNENGFLDSNGVAVSSYTETAWADPAEEVLIGRPDADEINSYFQLLDIRLDVDGLSFSFGPDTDNSGRFQEFFIPTPHAATFETQFDSDTRQFTIRFYHTSLASGPISEDGLAWSTGYSEYYDGLYPCSIPEGSLGEDNYFLTGAALRQDGEDVVLTCTLTERAYRFTVEGGDLGGGAIPSLRIRFRDHDWEMDDDT